MQPKQRSRRGSSRGAAKPPELEAAPAAAAAAAASSRHTAAAAASPAHSLASAASLGAGEATTAVDFAAGRAAIQSAAEDAPALHALSTRWLGVEQTSIMRLALLQIMALLQRYVLTRKLRSNKMRKKQATAHAKAFRKEGQS